MGLIIHEMRRSFLEDSKFREFLSQRAAEVYSLRRYKAKIDKLRG